MLNGWVAPAAIITLIGWSAGAVWWASGTDIKRPAEHYIY